MSTYHRAQCGAVRQSDGVEPGAAEWQRRMMHADQTGARRAVQGIVQPGDGSLADASGVPAVDMTVERKQVPCTELYAFVHMGLVQVAAHGRRIVMIGGKRQYRSLQRSQLCIKALVAGNGFVVHQVARQDPGMGIRMRFLRVAAHSLQGCLRPPAVRHGSRIGAQVHVTVLDDLASLSHDDATAEGCNCRRVSLMPEDPMISRALLDYVMRTGLRESP